MVGWSGARKNLTILAFILPTLLGVWCSTSIQWRTMYTSPSPTAAHSPQSRLCDVLNPCWSRPVGFVGNKPQQGLATPFSIMDPIYENYNTLLGKLASPESATSLLLILAWFVPLLAAFWLDRREGRKAERSISSLVIWLVGLALFVGLFNILRIGADIDQLTNSGAFFGWCSVPFSMSCAASRSSSLWLDACPDPQQSNLPGRTLFRVALVLPWVYPPAAPLLP